MTKEKYDRAMAHESREIAKRFKMYKSGKQWLFAASMFLAIAGGGALSAHADTVSADAESQPEDVAVNSNAPTNGNSLVLSKNDESVNSNTASSSNNSEAVAQSTSSSSNIASSVNSNDSSAKPTEANSTEANNLATISTSSTETGSVNVKYQTADGTDIIPSTTVSGTVGDRYSTNPAIIKNYHLVSSPSNKNGTFTSTNADVIYIYTPDTQYAYVSYVDDNTDVELNNVMLSGVGGTTSSYLTNEEIEKWRTQGYEVVSQDYPSGGVTFDINDAVNQLFTVHFKHALKTVTPDQPGTPGTPIDPSNPTGPKWPDGSDKNSLDKLINETVKYVYADGSKSPSYATDSIEFTRTATIDEVTSEITYADWMAKNNDTSFDKKVTPVVDGYYADKAQVNQIDGLTADSKDVNETVTYNKLGSLVPTPSDPNDPSWPKTPSVTYPNDPTDPTQPGKVTVPDVPGYTPQDGNGNPLKPGDTITPANPGTDTPIKYVANDENATVTFIDDTTGKTLTDGTKNLTGKFGTTDSYTTAGDITNYEKQGYELVSDGYPAGGVVYNQDGTVQSFEVHLKHATKTVTPEQPGTPGTPIDPSNPTGPKWPNGSDKDSLDKKVNETVNYVYADGSKTPTSVNDSVEFTRTATVDEVTGAVTYTDWSAKDNDTSFDKKVTPVVDGYYADKAQVNQIDGLTADSKDVNEIITYNKLGSLVPTPSDPNDPSWPKIPSVTYPNDPMDPTQPGKVTVPNVPGYTPQDGNGNPLKPGDTITPANPGTNTPIKYVVNDENATVKFIDDTTGKTLTDGTKNLAGKFGTTDSYTTAGDIANYEKQGYELVSDGYPAGGVVYNQDGTVQSFEVHLKHATKTVTPDQPGTPGTPIDPSNPTGPKWPVGTDKKSVDIIITETVTYEFEDGTTASNTVVDQVEYTRTAIVDEVTGEVTYTDWVAKDGDTTFDAKISPIINGYIADHASIDAVSGITIDSKDLAYKVIYSKVSVPNNPGTPTDNGTDNNVVNQNNNTGDSHKVVNTLLDTATNKGASVLPDTGMQSASELSVIGALISSLGIFGYYLSGKKHK
ncbi:LPXTG cell wall anchor domain-containing protein [Weissella muntiaci]|uniref:LPXTG cell wall anchor domain-containing protein n=1 Tax=Weissella muntiaci TaxID=2508881 RepID=A0A6C2C382_9LACO|nr:MucBP domain-containing protein [Weissella muntiaci]TYC48358.1 LPXTG cell wall anchor domain-containing protein [Weissella muntiaci]